MFTAPSGETSDQQSVSAEIHLQQTELQAERTVSAEVSQTTATNTSNVNVDGIVEGMMAAFVIDLETRNVRLAEIDGNIVAAVGQKLKAGDEPLIRATQTACQALKERQDGLALALRKALWLDAEPVEAGESIDIDPLVSTLSENLAADPFTAAGMKPVPCEKTTIATQEAVSVTSTSIGAPLMPAQQASSASNWIKWKGGK